MADELLGRDLALFDAKKEEIPGTFGGIGRNLVNNEVIGTNLAQSPYSRQVIGYPREGIADKQIRGRVRRCVLHRGEYIGCSSIRRRRRGQTPGGPSQGTAVGQTSPKSFGSLASPVHP